MHPRRLIAVAVVAFLAASCTDTRGPTELVPDRLVFSHTSSHPGEPLYKLTLTGAADAGADLATLSTTCDPRGHVIADERDQSLRAGGAEKSGIGEDRFQLRFTPDESSHELFGEDPICLGNVRPGGDWRDDLIIWYDRARGRHPATVSLQWYFTHGEGDLQRRYRLNGGSIPTQLTWAQITSGADVAYDGPYTLQDITAERNWPTVAEGRLTLSFEAELVSGGDDDDGGNGGDGSCQHQNPNHPTCR